MTAPRRVALLVAGWLWLAAAAGLAAQTSSAPSLDRVESLIAEGLTEDARTALVAWLDPARPAAARADAQRGIWLRALLTVDPAQAALDYQRLLVEYPVGPYSDRALLKLAQGARALGQPARARGYVETLLRDYPESPHRLDAGALLDAVTAEERSAAASPSAPAAPPASTEPITAQRPAEPAAAPTATAPPVASEGRWTVQLGAFASADRARVLSEQLVGRDIMTRLARVPSNRLVRVRTGRFDTQIEAERLRDDLVARGIQATASGDADREETVR